ncbi:hypothetical protein E2C01_005822 [Portunus trituberculatus]|uniref:Uncharacterized protein n=1 Tax=Portunus trituberculatus TaxID=210409 RepID=A0A5B7CTN9_PORTR|nr:hypothetical protein [Portunus trituberculatus]
MHRKVCNLRQAVQTKPQALVLSVPGREGSLVDHAVIPQELKHCTAAHDDYDDENNNNNDDDDDDDDGNNKNIRINMYPSLSI